MTTELTVFNFDQNTNIRTVMIDGEPHFVAKDICDALEILNNKDAIATLVKNYELIGIDIDGVVSNYPIPDSLGRLQEMNVVTEAGLYDLILQSRKPNALKFKHWISSEVLPSIRKNGFYGTESFVDMALNNTDNLIFILQKYKVEKQSRQFAEWQRDEAIKTKAYISDKKTATALAHTSVLSKQNEKLKEQIGDSKTFKQVKAINWLGEFFDMRSANVYSAIGKQLSKLSEALGYESRKIEDSKYGEVKAYHYEVINSLKFKLKNDLNMMQRFRL
jgi:prophage antirepressor-like protein